MSGRKYKFPPNNLSNDSELSHLDSWLPHLSTCLLLTGFFLMNVSEAHDKMGEPSSNPCGDHNQVTGKRGEARVYCRKLKIGNYKEMWKVMCKGNLRTPCLQLDFRKSKKPSWKRKDLLKVATSRISSVRGVKISKKTTPTEGTACAKDGRSQDKRSGWKAKWKTDAKGTNSQLEEAVFYQEGSGETLQNCKERTDQLCILNSEFWPHGERIRGWKTGGRETN